MLRGPQEEGRTPGSSGVVSLSAGAGERGALAGRGGWDPGAPGGPHRFRPPTPPVSRAERGTGLIREILLEPWGGPAGSCHPVSGSCASPRRFKPGGGDLISSETVLRGKLLTPRILTRDPKAAARWADLPPGGPSWARAGAHRPGRKDADLPRGLDTYGIAPACARPADMLLRRRKCAGRAGLRGQNGLCSLGVEEPSRAPVSQVKREPREATASSGRPWGWLGTLPTWKMSRGGEEAAFQISVWPSRTIGVLLGSLEKRSLPVKALLVILGVAETSSFLDGGSFLKLPLPNRVVLLLHGADESLFSLLGILKYTL